MRKFPLCYQDGSSHKMIFTTKAVSSTLAIFLAMTTSSLSAGNPVRVENGLLSGAVGKNPEVRVYKGIPYAAPPVGNLRWKAPKAAANWAGLREAAEFSPSCYQLPYPRNSIYY